MFINSDNNNIIIIKSMLTSWKSFESDKPLISIIMLKIYKLTASEVLETDVCERKNRVGIYLFLQLTTNTIRIPIVV